MKLSGVRGSFHVATARSRVWVGGPASATARLGSRLAARLDFNTTVIAVSLLGLTLFFLFCVWVVRTYRGVLLWPSLATGFVATALGVFLALALERELDRRRELSRERNAHSVERERRRAEVRRGFGPIAEELRVLASSLEQLNADLKQAVAYPAAELPTEAWDAARLRLGSSLGDFELLATLGQFYGRIRRLQNWIELRALAAMHGRTGEFAAIDQQLAQVVEASTASLSTLRQQVKAEIAAPSVDPIPLSRVGRSLAMPYEITDA